MTAWDARGMGMDDVQITVYTPERAPLEIFGAAASESLREDLEEAGIEVRTEAHVTATREGQLVVDPGDSRWKAGGSPRAPARTSIRSRSGQCCAASC